MSICCVCGTRVSLHEHHVVPRAYGGLNGPTVMICAVHHNLIHTAALNKNVTAREALLADHTEEQKIRLRELILVIRKSRTASKFMRRPMVLQLTLDPEQASQLRQLKKLIGASSLSQTVTRSLSIVYSYLAK